MGLYLDSSGSVWRDMGEHKLCNFNDTRLLPVVFNELVVAVLNSSLSSPVKCV